MKKIFIVLFFILLTAAAFCDSYYVCLSSFTDKKNAIELVKSLQTYNVNSFIYKVVVPGITRYRVLLNDPSERADDARMLRNIITNADYVEELGLTGLWVCFAPEPNGEEEYEETPLPVEIKPCKDPSSDLMPKMMYISVYETEDPVVIKAKRKPTYPKEDKSFLPKQINNLIFADETDEVKVEPPVIATPSVENEFVPDIRITFIDTTDDDIADTTPESEEPIVLAANSRDKMRFSEEYPFSVMVISYKEERNAESDAQRLCGDDWDAYVFKSYDDETYFSFDVLVSAYKTEQEAEEVVKQLEECGIRDTVIVEYGKMREKADKFDEVVRTQKVKFEKGNGQMPDIFGDYVRRAVAGFPLNRFYEIRNITVTDNDNMSARFQTEPDNGVFASRLAEGSHVHAVVEADYYDELYDRSMLVFIAAGNSGDFVLDESADAENVTVRSKSGIYKGIKYKTQSGWQLFAKNEDGSLMIHFEGEKLERSELDSFAKIIDDKADLLSLPQIRKTLCVLPKREDFNVDFLTFELNKVESDYVKEKYSVEWAIPIVGHWKSATLLTRDNDDYSVSFFDLDYNYIAEQTHKLFSAEHRNSRISEYNHAVEIGGQEGWYIYNSSSAELSFSTKSYIVAVGTKYHYENDLADLGAALQIWN